MGETTDHHEKFQPAPGQTVTRVRMVLPYTNLRSSRGASHPAVTINRWATLAIGLLILVLLSGFARPLLIDFTMAVASSTAVVSGVVTICVVPRNSKHHAAAVGGIALGAIFGILSVFFIYCSLTGVAPYL
jgi:hypothetical protein